ncbi:MAG: protein phosphatase 2C domain-containing protein [Methanoregula sp.]|nr:protein phosphatase 2C domain-containing protein [Methanoregula sp.]
MNLTYCGDTHICGRQVNEDALAMQQVTDHLTIFVVADGLGGHSAGEVASRLAVAALVDTVQRTVLAYQSISPDQMKKVLHDGFMAASRSISDDCSVNVKHAGMATTLLAALVNNALECCIVANVGDSRAYLANEAFTQITKDHSYVQELFERGLITWDELRLHPKRNIVTRVVSAVPVDPDFFEFALGKGTLVLCTDGLTGALSDTEIFSESQGIDVPRICRNLIDRARVIAGDNTTVIVVRVCRD